MALTTPPTSPSNRRGPRKPGLERLRAITTVAVVLLHASIAYMSQPLPGLAWSTSDRPAVVADLLGWGCNAFVMPVFFVLGGLTAASLLQRLGPAAMARHRLRRLGGPFLLGCVVILPLDLYAWLLGYAADGRVELRKLKSLKLDEAGDGLWGSSHLWFLQYLLLFCLALAACRHFGWRMPPGLRSRLTTPAGLVGLAVLTSVPLAIEPEILIGFRHAWVPLPLNVLFYGPMFAAGVLLTWPAEGLRIADHRAAGLQAFGVRDVALGVAALAAAGLLLRTHLSDGLAVESRWAMAFLYTTAGWLIAVGCLAAASRDERPLSRPLAALAAASFWIYLLHHPVVGCAQVALKPLAIPSEWKLMIVSAYGLGVPLMTFELCVRRTFIGRVLGVPAPAAIEAAPATPRRKAA